MHEQDAVVASKPVTLIIAHSPLLRGTRRGFKNARVGLTSKVTLSQRDNFSGLQAGDITPEEATGTIEPSVQSILKTVDSSLKIMCGKSCEEFLDLICFPIRIRIPREQDIGGCAH